ncbi:hypothetical protein [Desulfotignum balticum]|jgi:hypothetical protein|uniref:hypothetical protein n=1 Tax=Desulfotignum balticum TaxID=115781 RepID=UPI00040DCB89|nr:hypothetical protein [Desulfotignum balticum]
MYFPVIHTVFEHEGILVCCTLCAHGWGEKWSRYFLSGTAIRTIFIWAEIFSSGFPRKNQSVAGGCGASSATCATVRPRNKSAFAEFGNAAIFGKWYWNDVRARPDLFAILSWLLTLIQPARILLWVERRRMLT